MIGEALNQTALQVARAEAFNYSIILIFLSFAIGLIIVAKIYNKGKRLSDAFWSTWIFTLLIVGLISIGVSLYPNKLVEFINLFKEKLGLSLILFKVRKGGGYK